MPEKIILVVDSDPASLSYLAHLVQGQHYHVLQTELGKEGLIYAWRDQPHLILFDPALRDISGEEFVRKLRQNPRTASVPILAISCDPNPTKKEALLEAGCTEWHFKSGELIVELPLLLARMLGKPPEEKNDGGVLIIFMSAKGGMGTSSLCVNYAMSIARHKPEASVVVADLVLPLGSLASIVGCKTEPDLMSIAETPHDEINKDYFDKKLPACRQWDFRLLPGINHPERSNTLNFARIPEIVTELKANYDYVIVDLGRSLSRISLPLFKQADILAMVVGNDKSTVFLSKAVWNYLHEHEIGAKNMYVILNRAAGLEGLTKLEIEEILGLKVKTNLPYMRGDFALANNLHQPVIIKYPQASITLAIKETALEIITLAASVRSRQRRT